MGSPDTENEYKALLTRGKHLTCTFLCAMLVLSSAIAECATPAKQSVPFRPGEKLTYRARWGVISAGEVTLEILPMQIIDGAEAYHFVMETKTNAAFDFIYRVRQREESWVEAGMKHSILYKKRTEGNYPRDVVITFDWVKGEAQRSNFGEKTPPIPIGPGTFDPVALFYVIRLQDIKKNPVFEFPITEGDRNILVKGSVAQRQELQIADRIYDTFVVIPDLEGLEAQQVVKKSDEPELKIWFTADDKKIPVRIRSKVKVGHLDFDIVSD
jgi:hypothetical protein